MKRKFLVLLSVLSLLVSTISPVLAQIDPSHPIYLPLIGTDVNQASVEGEASSDPAATQPLYLPQINANIGQQRGELTISPDSSVTQAQSTETVTPDKSDKEVSAAGRRSAADLKLVSIIVAYDESVTAEQLAAVSGGQVVHRYTKVFHGASLVVQQGKIGAVQAVDGVMAVYLDTLQQPDSDDISNDRSEVKDDSGSFIGAPALWSALGGKKNAGEGVVVGVLDTGVWPEHPSFSDPDPSGRRYSAPAIRPPQCDFGSAAGDPGFSCNNKLIGAYTFLDTYIAVVGLLPQEFDSARDTEGHGTHTASTAAGNFGVRASIYGIDRGPVSGIAPRAQIIAYRVCADEGCFESDSVAAIDQAITDGVNVINFSIGGGSNPYSDAVEMAFLEAYRHGIFVAASAGNSGPGADSVEHRGPWVTTVAASTFDHSFLSTLTLKASNGDRLRLVGATVTAGINTPTPVVMAPGGNCAQTAPAFSGKIVVCDRVGARIQVGHDAAQAGATGMILRNITPEQGKDILTDNHFLPSIHINLADGAALQTFMASHSGVVASFTQGAVQRSQGDRMASFSSRGGPAQTLGVSKPDITAPGVQILAGNTPLPATILSGFPGQLFQAIQGTSMSSPHIAGSAALLKDLHPNWTPGQIKSALMTSGVINGVTKEDGVTPANAFDFGSGRVDLSQAGNVDITFDQNADGYVALENQLWNANYPSLFVPDMPGRITVKRTMHNLRNGPRSWSLEVRSPKDLNVSVPNRVVVAGNGDATFEITLDASTVPQGQVRFATLQFKQGNQRLNFPITIVRGQPDVAVTKTCAPASIQRGQKTNCTITVTNSSFEDANISVTDRLPDELSLVKSSVTGATANGNGLSFNGALAAAEPPEVSVKSVPSALFGYVPLADYGVAPVGGVGDESITNFNVPAFQYAGETYTKIGVVSNGYIVVGGGAGADIDYLNTALPDPTPPNNVLAPFWTDLNPTAAGAAIRVSILTDGTHQWLVVDWDKVPNFSDSSQKNSFEVWIQLGLVEGISFAYAEGVDGITDGDGGFLTVGAENRFGNSGGTVYLNDGETIAGAPPSSSNPRYEVVVSSSPPMPGASHVITFAATAQRKGKWTNCAQMTAQIFQGVNIACFNGEVTR